MLLPGRNNRISVASTDKSDTKWVGPVQDMVSNFEVHGGSAVSVARRGNYYHATLLGKDKTIYHTASPDGLRWSTPNLAINSWKTNGSAPSLVAIDNMLYMVRLGEDHTIAFASSADGGQTWNNTGYNLFNGWKTNGSTPSLSAIGNTLYMVRLGEDHTIAFASSTDGGHTWNNTAYNLFSKWKTNGSTPSLTAVGNTLYMVRLGGDRTIAVSSSSDGGRSWHDLAYNLFNGWKTSGSTPSLSAKNNVLYMVRIGEDKTVSLASSQDNGSSWHTLSNDLFSGWRTNDSTPALALLDFPLFNYSTHRHDWMKYLKKDVRLVDAHIPCSHDSSSYAVDDLGNILKTVAAGAVTQWGNYTHQLNVGVRYFDVRCKEHNGTIHLHHGSIILDSTLEQVLRDQIVPFSNRNPSELIFLDIDLSGDIGRKVLDVLLNCIDEQYIATEHLNADKTFNTAVTWGDLAGKRFVIAWGSYEFYGKPWLSHRYNLRRSAGESGQKGYEAFDYAKLGRSVSAILNYLDSDLSRWEAKRDKLYIAQVVDTPHWSPVPFENPIFLERLYHNQLNSWVTKNAGRLNVVMRDFVNAGYNEPIIQAIVDSNAFEGR